MNTVHLIGRLTKDPEVRYTQGENSTAIARYTLAVDRKNKKNEADFINMLAFGKSGEFVEKYLHKGMKIAIRGHIQTGSYTNRDNQKVYTTEVVVDEHEFCESKQDGGNGQNKPQSAPANDGFWNIPDGIEESLPFN